MAKRWIYTGNGYAADEFEMLPLLFYQELNQECAEILADRLHPEHFYATANYPPFAKGSNTRRSMAMNLEHPVAV